MHLFVFVCLVSCCLLIEFIWCCVVVVGLCVIYVCFVIATVCFCGLDCVYKTKQNIVMPIYLNCHMIGVLLIGVCLCVLLLIVVLYLFSVCL